MRLHRLAVEGIGPYAVRQELDLDELTAQGLFLLTGPTGAGKTTVLDAIVFALYGTVPGARSSDGKTDRRVRERIVSDLRALETKPNVELEFTIAGRRLLVRRSPDHERPKSRGEGTTMEKASASLEELVDGMWIPRSTDFEEISVELQLLLGMNAAQFTQVVLLPQGEFAGFLRASVKDRRAVLERLFQVDAYQSAESWFQDRAIAAKATLADAEARVAVIVERLVGALGEHAGEAVPARGAGPDEVAGWIAAHRSAVDERFAAAEATAMTTQAAAEAADAAYALAVGLAELEAAVAVRDEELKIHADRIPGAKAYLAKKESAALAGDEDRWIDAAKAARADSARVESHLPGEARLPQLAAAASTAEQAAEAAEAQATEADGARAAALAELTPAREAAAAASQTEERRLRLTSERDVLRGRLEAMERRAALDARVAEAEAGAQRSREAEAAETAALAAAPAEAELDEQATVLDADRAALARQTAGLEAERRQLAAEQAAVVAGLEQRTGLAAERTALVAARDARRDAHHAARSAVLAAREARLEAMAAELAAGLHDGEACPVCGSPDHPAPAHPAGPADLRAREAAAEAHATETEAALAVAEHALASCDGRLAGLDPAALDARADELLRRGGEAQAAEAAIAATTTELEARTVALQRRRAARRTAVDALDRARSAAATTEQHLAALREERATAAAEAGAGTPDALRAQVEPIEVELRRLATAVEAAAAARQRVGELEAAAERSASQSAAGRASAAEQRERARNLTDEATRLHAELTTARGSHPSVTAAAAAAAERARVLEAAAELLVAYRVATRERGLVAAQLDQRRREDTRLPGEPDDLTELVAARTVRRAEADASAGSGAAVLADAGRARRAVTDAETALAGALSTLGPAAEAAQRMIRLDETIRGLGDNLQKISLATYVLAARLEQVAAAATSHLLRMSSGRYELVHHAEKFGGGQAGLGLRVRDGWTGEERDTATLSGGEAFYASLALALGLAEVVTNEAGGRPLDTLLVDEGFGSLDPDTLDEVLGELDQLRAAGRAIGLVSHVQALAERIPAQLRVEPGRSGSTARVVTGAPV